MVHVLSGNSECKDGNEQEVTGILQKAHLARKGAEHSAKQLLHRLERNLAGVHMPGCATSPWEDLSSNSHTTRCVLSALSNSTALGKEIRGSGNDETSLFPAQMLYCNCPDFTKSWDPPLPHQTCYEAAGLLKFLDFLFSLDPH